MYLHNATILIVRVTEDFSRVHSEPMSDEVAPGWTYRAKRIMRAKGLIQDDLCKPLGVKTRGAVGHYFTGRRQLNLGQAVALAHTLQCSMDELFDHGRSEDESMADIAAQLTVEEMIDMVAEADIGVTLKMRLARKLLGDE